MLRIGSIVRHHRWRMRNSADSGHTNIRDFQIQRRGRPRECQKNNRFYKQNNNFARVLRFFVHFFARFCTTTTWKCLISHFMEDVNKQRLPLIFLFVLGVLRVYSSCTSPYISYAIGEKFVCNSQHLLLLLQWSFPFSIIVTFAC